MDDLPFVTGAIWHRPMRVTVQVRVRERLRKNRPRPGSDGGKSSNDAVDAAARKVTSQMKEDVKSAAELLKLLDGVVEGPIFNDFHASAAYHSLATKWKGGLTPSDISSPVLPRLGARVQDMALKGQLQPRAISNVFWSLGQLCDDVDISKGLLTALVQTLREKASRMNAHDLSNNLLACVQLKGVAPEVLTVLPKLAAQISIKAKDMVPQALSNSLWAFAHLKEDASHEDVAKIVAALVGQIPDKAKDMIPQHLSNSLWAAAQLKDVAPDATKIVPAIVAQIQDKANGMIPQGLSNSLYAAAQLKDIAPEVKEIVPAIVAQIPDKASGMIPQHLSNSLWAIARLKNSAPEVLLMVPALVEEIPRNQADFKSQEICNCLEALVLLQDSVPAVDHFLAAAPGSKNDFLGGSVHRFSTLLPTLKGNDLKLAIPGVVWACARVNFYHEALSVSSAVNPYHGALLVSVAQHLKSDGTLQGLTDWGLCALQWSYDVLDPDGRFVTFKDTLESERVRRGLSDSDVSESALGIFEWNRAKS